MLHLHHMKVFPVSKGNFELNGLFRIVPSFIQICQQKGLHDMPEKLAHVPTAQNPKFFDMVEYFFHRASQIAADKLVDEIKTKMSVEEKQKRVIGILKIMQPCDRSKYIYRFAILNFI